MTMQNHEPSLSAPGNDEPEPWTVGAVIHRTSQFQARLTEAANERKPTTKEVDVPNSEARPQAMVEEDVEMPTVEAKHEVIAEEKRNNETSTEETSIRDGGGGESVVHATMMLGLPTTRKEIEVDLRSIEEKADNRRRLEENALAAKGSHNGKYGGARNWNHAYSQRATPMSLNDRDTIKSGWGFSGLGGSFGPAMDEPYYDYATGASSSSASSPYSSPYGYARKRNSHYAYVSGPAN